MGRLGNILFQVASAIGISSANNRRLVIAPTAKTFLQKLFSNQKHKQFYTTGVAPKGTKMICESDQPFFDYKTFYHLPNSDIQICNYLMSWKYTSLIILMRYMICSPPQLNIKS